METISVIYQVTAPFHPYIDACIVRLSYLYPDLDLSSDGSSVFATGRVKTASNDIKSEIAHALYREKIFADTLGIRTAIHAALFSQ